MTCATCGITFPERPGAGRPRKYCPPCARTAKQAQRLRYQTDPEYRKRKIEIQKRWRTQTPYTVPCQFCGTPMTNPGRRLWCSKTCRNVQRGLVHKVWYHNCQTCAALFAAPQSCRKWCSKTCYQARKHAGRSGYLKQAVKNGRRVDRTVTIEYIYKRDSGKCHICHQKVSQNQRSMDHLIPLSKGGHHTGENVALAHRRCNSRRGAGRLPAQLLLVG